MPSLTDEEAKDLKAKIYDLDEQALKQVLFGLTYGLTLRSTIPSKDFKQFILDGELYTKARRKA